MPLFRLSRTQSFPSTPAAAFATIGINVCASGIGKKKREAVIMMRKCLAMVTAAMLLASCSDPQEVERTVALRQRYAELAGWEATVQLALPREQETREYTLELSCSGEEISLVLLAPEELAGMGASLTGEELKLQFDGLVLDGGTANEKLNGFNAVPFVVESIADGYLLEEGTEELDGAERLRLGLEGELNGALLHTAVFFSDEDLPLFAEISENGKILARMEFTDFVFGAIMPLE